MSEDRYIFEGISDRLKSINDIQRLHRKMALKKYIHTNLLH